MTVFISQDDSGRDTRGELDHKVIFRWYENANQNKRSLTNFKMF